MGERVAKRQARRGLIPVTACVLAVAVSGCPLVDNITGVTAVQDDTSQKTEVWAFIATDSKGSQEAKVVLRGCTAASCTGATLTSVSPYEWKTQFGSCTLPWHLSGQVSGDLVSFTINGTGCETSLQGRSGSSGGRLNGRFGTATSTVGSSPMSWNGFTTLFSSSGSPQAFSGSGTWRAVKCVRASDCGFPVP